MKDWNLAIEEIIFSKEDNAQKININSIDIAYIVSIEAIFTILKLLKEDHHLRFTILTDLFAADFLNREKRFEVGYNLLSLKLNKRIILKLHADEKDILYSVESIFSNALWYEREVFDMYGVKFDSSSSLERILTDYNFKGHPLRKDFPLTGHVQVRYDQDLKEVINEPVKLDTDYREFDFATQWSPSSAYTEDDVEPLLPGDEKALIENK